jgi:NitT/TauT family transport system substrate-binding protein
VRSVLSGQSEFGVASPSHLLEAPQAEALCLLLAIQQASPLVYPVHRDSGIESLGDLVGRKVAVWPGGEDLELRWLLHKAGVPADRVERVPTGDTVAAFVSGAVASAQMTLYHELHQLEAAGFPGRSLRLFRAADHGAALLKDGLFTTRKLARDEPALVQAVVDAVLEGWAEAFAAPEEAVAACLAKNPALDEAGQRQQLADIRALTFCHGTLDHGLGYPDPHHVRQAAMALSDLGESPSPGRAEDVIDGRFWEAAPAAFKVRA